VGIDANWRRLAAAMLLQAARDVEAEDPDLAAEARRWLAGEGVDLVEALGVPVGRVETWLQGLPGLPWEQLPLFGC